MEDVLALYEKPPSSKEPVVCVDEKPVVLHADVRPPHPMQPGQVARRDCEYQRCGSVNAFCGVEPKAGRHFVKITSNRSSPEFADYLAGIVASYSEADTIHLVMDNLSSHRRKALVERYGEENGGQIWDRFTVHYTPKHGRLAEPGGNRDQPVQSPMPGTAQNPVTLRTQTGGSILEPKGEPWSNQNQLEIHAQEGPPEVWLQAARLQASET